MPTSSLREKVAEIAGWVCPDCKGSKVCDSFLGFYPCNCRDLPPYDTSTDAALEAYAVMKARGWDLMATYPVETQWVTWLSREGITVSGKAPILAQAICEAIVAASERERG